MAAESPQSEVIGIGSGRRFHRARIMRGYSIAFMARELSCSRSQINAIERCDGAFPLNVRKAIMAARLLGVSVGWLLAGELQSGVIVVSEAVEDPAQALDEVRSRQTRKQIKR